MPDILIRDPLVTMNAALLKGVDISEHKSRLESLQLPQ